MNNSKVSSPRWRSVCVLLVLFAAACGKEETATAVREARKTPPAPWVAEPANPLKARVVDTVPPRAITREIGIDGGELTLQTSEHRITLEFPPDTLPWTQEITLRLTDVTGLPFANGAEVAVRIEPADIAIHRPLFLELTPRQTTDGQRFAGFAARNGEMNLHPVMHLDVPAGARSRSKARLLLGAGGSYGIAVASPDEIAVIARHLPADPLARVEQTVALALTPPARTAALPFFVAFMQIASQPVTPPSQAPSAWLQQLLDSIRDAYEDVVLPGLDGVPKDDCLSPALRKAIEAYVRWTALNQLLLPVQPDADLMKYPEYATKHNFLVAQRHRMLRERGFTDSQIEEIDREIEKYRENLDEVDRRLRPRLIEELKNAFHRLHRCCMTQKPLQYHVDSMVGILRAGALFGEETLIADAWTPIRECACRVASASKGAPEGFFGTVKQKETLEIDETFRSAGGAGQMQRTQRTTRILSYEVTLNVTRALTDRTMYADVSAKGSDEQLSLVSDDYGECTVEAERRYRLKGHTEDAQSLSLHLRPKQGLFNLSFNAVPAEGRAEVRQRREVRGGGCNPFEVKRNSDKRSSHEASVRGTNVDIIDAPYDPKNPILRGSRKLEGERRGGVRSTVELEWNLRRCGQ